jgi:acetolactate synthase-1/2/3 large subunit
LREAQRPAIVAGSGVHVSEAWDELARLAEQAAIPVATTIHGKGSLAETSPWSLGVAGANGARAYANAYLAAADVVLFVGTRANATDTNSYASPPRHGPTVIGLDVAEERAGRNYPGSLRLVGDARTVLHDLRTALPPAGGERCERLRSWIADQRAVWQGAARSHTRQETLAGLDPAGVVCALREVAGGEAIVVADPGTPTPNVAAYWETTRAGRRIVVPRGHGPMGYAIPGAIGAALAYPGRRIVAFTGDGSFAMSCGELETACRLRLPITYVHFTNGSMGWIKMLQHLYLERRYFGVDLGPVDTPVVAQGFGLAAAQPTTLEELTRAFRTFEQAHGPAFIDVVVPDEIESVPPVAPWQAALAGEGTRPSY